MSEEGSPPLPPEEEWDSPQQEATGADASEEPAAAPPAPPEAVDFVAPPRPKPLLGPVLSVAGALLWSYVVMGQLTTSWLSGQAPLGEGLALTGVMLSTGAALVVALSQSPAGAPGASATVKRAGIVLVLSLLLVVAVVVLATVAGAMSRSNLDVPITLALLGTAVITLVSGWRLSRALAPPLSHRQRVFAIAFWAFAAAVTLTACGELNV
jgi:hypothetical protein